jgi:hypothetical protein
MIAFEPLKATVRKAFATGGINNGGDCEALREMVEWRRSRINRAALDLPPGWVGRPYSKRHSSCSVRTSAQRKAGGHTYVATRGGSRAVLAHDPPRERPDQGKRAEAGSHRYAVACVPNLVGNPAPIMVGIDVRNRVTEWDRRNARPGAPQARPNRGSNCRMFEHAQHRYPTTPFGCLRCQEAEGRRPRAPVVPRRRPGCT